MGQRTSPYSTTIVEAEGELGRLLPEWWALWSRTARTRPFSSPAWLLPWWDTFHPGELFTAAVCRDGLLVGPAPFYNCARAGGSGPIPWSPAFVYSCYGQWLSAVRNPLRRAPIERGRALHWPRSAPDRDG